MKFKFKIQQYQADAVENTVAVFNDQPSYSDAMKFCRDLGKRSGVITDADDDAGCCSRKVIEQGAEMLGWPLEEML